jgi:glycerol-3-phosphate dehydrogenase
MENKRLGNIKREYDLIIVGGGIYGATLLWEATQRGLTAILIEKNDFCSATSANSLKIIHGGLRYMQNLDLKRVRESSKELIKLVNIAPHLIHPLPCVIPTYPQLKSSKRAFQLAFHLHDLINFNGRQQPGSESEIPSGKIIPLGQLRNLIPTLDDSNITGGAMWYDALNYNSERLVLSFILSAKQQGADAFNYLAMKNLILQKGRSIGINAYDKLTGQELEVFGKIVVNTTGPWLNKLDQQIDFNRKISQSHFVKAVNLIIRRPLSNVAFGLKVNEAADILNESNRYLFFVPWRGVTMIGTWYFRYDGSPDNVTLMENEFDNCIGQIQRVLPGADIIGDEVCHMHIGLIPAVSPSVNKNLELKRHYSIIDYQRYGGPDGVISVLGVKYTTARNIAAKTIKYVSKKIGCAINLAGSRINHLVGGDIESLEKFLQTKKRNKQSQLDDETIEHMILNYGTKYDKIIELISINTELGEIIPGSNEAIKGELLYCIENEFAYHLSDLLIRRTDIGSLGKPDEETTNYCADFMAKEMGWTHIEKQNQVNSFLKYYDLLSLS